MKRLHTPLVFAALLSLSGCGSATVVESVASAHYTNPVDRYQHFALGKPHEYASLAAVTRSGRTLTLHLPTDEVFEDLAPRRVQLSENEPDGLLAIVSQRDRGARLVLIQPHGDRLVISAQSPAIGTPNRWLNPVGVADLDGDGQAEIAAVITPHIGGTLKVYRKSGHDLVEIASLRGFSNHIYGSPELDLSTFLPIDGRMHLLVPDTSRRQLRIIAMKNDRLVEVGSCVLSAPITGAIKPISAREASVITATGQQIITPGDCIK